MNASLPVSPRRLTFAVRLLPLALVLAAALVNASRFGVFAGTPAALLVVFCAQFLLPGWLVSRALVGFPPLLPLQLAALVAGGFALTVPLAAVCRLLGVSVPLYLILLHGVMLALALARPAAAPPVAADPTPARARLALYVLLALCVATISGVALERNQDRFVAYEDQTWFVELADWFAHEPDDSSIRSRRVGYAGIDTRLDTDGWTFTHAAWVWASGVPAADLIWHHLTPLLIWSVPLAVFALAHALTYRLEPAVYSVLALTVCGLLTVDALVQYPSWLTFGQFSLFQVNTLRTLATALVTPLALWRVVAYLRRPTGQTLVYALLVAAALAVLHPRQIMILLYISAGLTAFWLLMQPSRQRLLAALALAAALAAITLLPAAQRLLRPGLDTLTVEAVSSRDDDAPPAQDAQPPPDARGRVLTLALPLLGQARVVDPATVFYHPLVGLTVLIGVGALLFWRTGMAAQFLAASTLPTLILLFVPPFSTLFVRLVTPLLAPGFALALPVALAFGTAGDALLTRLRLRPTTRAFAALLVGTAALVVLLFEPVPVPASARDQIDTANTLQSMAAVQPADLALITAMRAALAPHPPTVILAPDRLSSLIVESIPRARITGGRASSNLAFGGTRRFFSAAAPFVDADDLAFLQTYAVTHIIVPVDAVRYAHMRLQPERFAFVIDAGGYALFAVRQTTPVPADALWTAYNAALDDAGTVRWQPPRYELTLPGSPERWTPLLVAPVADDPGAALARAAALTLAGDDAAARAAWAALHAAYSDIPLFAASLAVTESALGQPAEGARVLLAALDSPDDAARVAAAHLLLTETFVYLLDAAALDRVLAVTERDANTWQQLAEFDRADAVRARIVLMLARGRYAVVRRWHEALPYAERDPRDFITRAAADLAEGDSPAARAVLLPTLDRDRTAANRHLHPDRWADDLTAQALASLDQPEGTLHQLAAARALYVLAPAVERPDETTLTISAAFASPHLAPYPVRLWRAQLIDPATGATFTSAAQPLELAPLEVRPARLELVLPADLPMLTPAVLVIEPRYDNRVTFGQTHIPLTLNRPDDTPPPSDAVLASALSVCAPECRAEAAADAAPVLFGDAVALTAYTLSVSPNALYLVLYWQAHAPPPADYQVFVQVIDRTSGAVVAQRDVTPVDNRYPTSQWRTGVHIADAHRLDFTPSLQERTYDVIIGLYTLPDGERLPVNAPLPAGRIQNASLFLAQLSF